MELEAQPSNTSSPCLYATAPNSPNEHSRSMEFYYSAPASPRQKPGDPNVGRTGDDHRSKNLDDFEFETSKKFSGPLSVEMCENSESPVRRERGGSLPSMAFADELFLNGLVMPLKLPPRLQFETEYHSFSQRSPVSSPRTVCRLPFARRSSWNDDFDPFMVALQKVREEKRGRNSHHRRSRSYSPFRAVPKHSNDNVDCYTQESSPTDTVHVAAGSFSGPLDFKGSAYARWVRDQTREGLSPKDQRGFLFGQRVRPLKAEQDGQDAQDEPVSRKGRHVKKNCGNVEESKVKKLKGFLLRYTSFGRENSGSKQRKKGSGDRRMSYFSRLSFKSKGSGKKRMAADTQMAVVEYKPSLAVCLGYGVGSPREVK
ncbi:UNVERIFIED_CONTAM: hypothetical protein Sangu_0422600 [Sesamum angustifolium]|uniref:Uncharacterized protein n=1 Tax=Sesamum angustifolium TaxID=2727405 RepID=A0AAW2QSY7_9LAMI